LYIEYVLQGRDGLAFDLNKRNYFERIKHSLSKWANVKSMLISHAIKITTEFNPNSSGFDLLSNYLHQNELEWLRETAQNEYSAYSNFANWVKHVEGALKKVDDEMTDIKKGVSDVVKLRMAVDDLMEIYSGRGYFNYDRCN
jgi:hypothetical protein